jgi:hypothetical protein
MSVTFLLALVPLAVAIVRVCGNVEHARMAVGDKEYRQRCRCDWKWVGWFHSGFRGLFPRPRLSVPPVTVVLAAAQIGLQTLTNRRVSSSLAGSEGLDDAVECRRLQQVVCSRGKCCEGEIAKIGVFGFDYKTSWMVFLSWDERTFSRSRVNHEIEEHLEAHIHSW